LTITGRDTNIVGSDRATIVLPMGTQVIIKNALLYSNSTRTLLSYRDIHKNGLHVVTHEENHEKFLYIIKKNGDDHDILERIPSLSYGLYYTYIKHVPYVAYKIIFQNVDAFTTCMDALDIPKLG
jgi:L-cysteine desulfidase